MISIPQSTAYVVVFKAYLSSDHVTEATGKTIAITISKNGGAFGNPNAGATNATEISSGWYKFTLDTTDTNTVGPIAYRGAVATIDDVGSWVNVVSATTGGLTNLDAAISTRASQASVDTLDDFVDTEVSAIKTVTDQMVFGTANRLNVQVFGIETGAIAAASFAASAITSTVVANGFITSAKFGGSAINAAALATDAAQEIADALLDRADGVETGLTPRQAWRLSASADAAKVSGAATTTNTFRNAVADSKDRMVVTVDADGNRTAITYDLT